MLSVALQCALTYERFGSKLNQSCADSTAAMHAPVSANTACFCPFLHGPQPAPTLMFPVLLHCCVGITFSAVVLQAADYLQIKGLNDLACQAVANLIKGETASP